MRTSLLILALGLLGAADARCQPLLADSLAAVYPFLNPGDNILRFPGGDSPWGKVFQKMHALRNDAHAQLRILHIGGSHVQGGVFHEQIRLGLEALVSADRGAAPGFFFPYALSGTNMPAYMTVHATGKWEGRRAVKDADEGAYGLSALQAITETPFASVIVSIRHPRRGAFRARTLRIYYDMAASTLIPEPFSYDCPDHIRFDSLAGYVEWQYENPQDALDLVLLPQDQEEAKPRFVLWGMEYLDHAPALIMDMVGANGASLKTYLDTEWLGPHTAALAPELVIFGIGVNDANGPNGRFDPQVFEARYEALMQVFRTANPEVVFLFITNNDTWYKKRQVNRNVLAVVETMQRLAIRHQAAVWDQFALMGGLNSIVAWQRAGLAKNDRIHFTAAGYTLLGQLLSEAFRCALEDHGITEQNDPRP